MGQHAGLLRKSSQNRDLLESDLLLSAIVNIFVCYYYYYFYIFGRVYYLCTDFVHVKFVGNNHATALRRHICNY
jgi:hypothetical protein